MAKVNLLRQKRILKIKKMERRINTFRTMLRRIRVLLALVIIALILLFGFKLLRLPQWYIDSTKLSHADPEVLQIVGNVITPDYKIINLIRQTKLPNVQIFRLDTKELEQNLEQLQTVKKVYVRRYWFPARLQVALDERTIAFLLAPNLETEPMSALTTDGVLLDHDYFPFKTTAKARKLLTYGVHDGVDEVWDKKKVDEILKLIKAIEAYSNQEVQYIDFRNQSDIYIMLQEHLVRFGELNDTSLARAKWIASILPEAKKYKDKLKYIDLRWEDSRYLRLEGSDEQNHTNKVKKQNEQIVEEENAPQEQEEETNEVEEPQEQQN